MRFFMNFSRRHILFIFFTAFIVAFGSFPSPATAETFDVPVGLILNSDRPVGKIAPVCINLALEDFYVANPNFTTKLAFTTKDSAGDVVAAASAAVDLIRNAGVHAVVGPQSSAEADFVADLGEKAAVPIISFSATSPSLSPARAPFFVRTAVGDAAQAAPIAALVQAFGWRRAVPVFEDTDYGSGFIPYLVDALGEVGTTVPYRSQISLNSTDNRISKELYRLQTMQTQVFIVHMSTTLAGHFFTLVDEAGMMGDGYVWIATAGLIGLLESLDTNVVHDSMQGVLGLKPYIPRSPQYDTFKKRFKIKFIKENTNISDVPEPSTYGLWAYDTVWALGLAAEAVGAENLRHDRRRSPQNSSSATDLSDLGFRLTGHRLLDEVLNTSFDSLGGKFLLNDGERNVTAFQLVNIVGEKAKEIGFWTAKFGITRRLNWTSSASYSATRDGLGPVIWPGEPTVVPKGWQTPTAGKKLIIAVPGPVERGFHSFLSVGSDPVSNETVAGGFVIEVFEAAVRRLPYALPFEYVPHVNKSGKGAGDYTEMVKQVYFKRYDAVVGDTTLTAERSTYVDFTLPYTVAGISMVVPIKDERSKNAWIFLKPLTADLWVVSFMFFIFTGIVIWILEHRVNEEFRGPPTNQIGTVFYFTFSTLVFSHKENIVNNFSRVVVIIWVFVVLILQSSYTASLTSMLTVRQIEPVVTDFKTLIANKEYVGHLQNSFVKGLLIKHGFDSSRLKPYRSPQAYAEALAKGSRNGGVAAVVDEIPYLKLFLKDYCSNYTMVGPTYKTAGFGFVFPKGSPIVPDLSRAILNLTESEDMSEIEKRWFGDSNDCPNRDNTITSQSLDFGSFWGLFMITGTASLVAFTIHWIQFFLENRHALRENVQNPGINKSWRRRIRHVFKLHDQKDFSSHTFRKQEQKNTTESRTSDRGQSPTGEAYATGSDSPFSFSNHTFDDLALSIELETPSRESPAREDHTDC